MKLSDLNPEEIELVQEAPKTNRLRLSDLNPDEIELQENVVQPESSFLDTLGDTSRGIVQGATFGFGEEAIAGIKSAPTAIQSLLEQLNVVPEDQENLGDVYRKIRDTEREANKLAAERSPIAYNVGDIGTSIATGVLTGGAGLIGKVGMKTAAKELLKKGIEKGALPGLMALGAAEGAAHGLGRSEADLTKGELGEAAFDTAVGGAVGAVAPVAIKGIGNFVKGTASTADDLLEKAWAPGRVYKQIKKIGASGASTPDIPLSQKADEALMDAYDATSVLQKKAVTQGNQYVQDLAEGKVSAGKGLYKHAKTWRQVLQKGKEIVGDELERNKIAINEQLKEGLTPYTSLVPGKKGMEFQVGQFNLDQATQGLDDMIQGLDGSDKINVKHIINKMKSGDFLQITDQMQELNKIIEGAKLVKPQAADQLRILKQNINNTLSETLDNLPESQVKNLYKKHLDLNKDYSLYAGLQEGMDAAYKGDPIKGTSKVGTKFSVAANPVSGGLDSPEYMEILNAAYRTGDRNLIEATEAGLESARLHNKFQFQTPEIDQVTGKIIDKIDPETGQLSVVKRGSMFKPGTPEHTNEQIVSLFEDAFSKQREGKSSSSLKRLADIFSNRPSTQGDIEMKKAAIAYIKKTWPDQADMIIKDLTDISDNLNLHRMGLDDSNEFNQDLTSKIRFLRSMGEPLAYDAGRLVGGTKNVVGDLLQSLNRGPIKEITDVVKPGLNPGSKYRTLTQPQFYKDTVQQFKDSQKQGDTEQ